MSFFEFLFRIFENVVWILMTTDPIEITRAILNIFGLVWDNFASIIHISFL